VHNLCQGSCRSPSRAGQTIIRVALHPRLYMPSNLPGFGCEIIAAGAPRRLLAYPVTWLGGIHADQVKTVPPLRFRLLQLFCVVTLAAVLLALFKALGIFGAVLSFVTALVFTNVVYPLRRAEHEQEAMFDFVWGIVMPVVCLVFDPVVFKPDDLFLRVDPAIPPSLQPPLASLQLYPGRCQLTSSSPGS